ncbi:polysaccharide pyruvyl transferase family protein [Cognatishimia sp. F0-27]|uniref:polysaccharide pyruvyl transferase family protein n=1 Tax=Cognatishimia sp. F0-27 TaxID=2816855 RepID=UPI001D0CD217|nr:polysaccharide pyruvyl transferase family protein [Cognatishimia sp. F0-27]MCC1494042.1 polysaccharide pyruvyl transferase family protein [Cognatishimia sp. F0-27]
MLKTLFSSRAPQQSSDPKPKDRYADDPFGRLVVVSFYTPGGYYEEKANELRAQCDQFGLNHDISEITLEPNEDWADICRRKVRHYRAMLHKHQCAIMWLDVDSVLANDIGTLHQGHFDVALFMRNFKYLPQYNPGSLARSFHPGYLLFRYTPRTIQFLDDCMKVDQTHEGSFTDDYILEEAFRTSEAQMRLLVLSPDDIARPNEGEKPDALFRHGDSGNVNEYKGKVLQHTPRMLEGESIKRVITQAVALAAKRGKRAEVVTLLESIMRAVPDDFETHVKLLTMLEKSGDEEKFQRLIDRGLANPELAPFTLRFQLLKALEAHDWPLSDELYKKIEATGHERMTNFSKSRIFRYSLDRRAEEMGIDPKKRTPLFWWEEPYPGNLGDIINPYIVEKLTGIPPRYAKNGKGVCAIGSIIKFAKAGTPVWGSGSPHKDDVLDPLADYRAVRGPITRDLVLRNGGTCPEVYGDAAWFLPIIYKPDLPKTHKTGLILHYTHEEAEMEVGDEIRRIDIRRLGYDQIEQFMDEILQCERIISTSLHGVIIAQAYGLPAALAQAENSAKQIHGDGIKFNDYFASVGLTGPIPHYDVCQSGVKDETLPDEIFRKAAKNIPLVPLLEAAPFEALPEYHERARAFDQSA